MYVASVYDKKYQFHMETCDCCKEFPEEGLICKKYKRELIEMGFSPCNCIEVIPKISTDDIFQYIQECCTPYGLYAHREYDFVIIHTKFSKWRFSMETKKISLFHKNYRGHHTHQYHKQFEATMDYKDLIQYIALHDGKRYKTEKIEFTK